MINTGTKLKATFAAMLATTVAWAGNPQRAGEAGASEMLINPFARTAGFAESNIAFVDGAESIFTNIAGLASIERMDLTFANTQWFSGTGIQLNTVGFATKVGDQGVLGIGLQSIDMGTWEVTTEEQPNGTGATISPQTLLINLGYAQQFTDRIQGGVNVKLYNSAIANLSTIGLAFDAGVQYRTGDKKEYQFGITLRNVGPAIGYAGDGHDLTLSVPTFGVPYEQTYQSRAAAFELPAQLRIGGGYDLHLVDEQILTFAAAFTSNSFDKDEYGVGLQYSMKKYAQFRLGYRLLDNRVDGTRNNAMTGIAGGFSFNMPLSADGNTVFSLDYGYRHTNPFNGIHVIGARITL